MCVLITEKKTLSILSFSLLKFRNYIKQHTNISFAYANKDPFKTATKNISKKNLYKIRNALLSVKEN